MFSCCESKAYFAFNITALVLSIITAGNFVSTRLLFAIFTSHCTCTVMSKDLCNVNELTIYFHLFDFRRLSDLRVLCSKTY